MMGKRARFLVPLLIGLAILMNGAVFVVNETEQVVITQLGRPVGSPIKEAGLHFKIPVVQTANYFEKRVMKWDGSPNQIPTKDKKYIWIDTTARWHISDPLLFLQRVGSISTAHSRLDGIIDSVVRDHVSSEELVELVRSEGWELARRNLGEIGLQDVPFGEIGAGDADPHMQKGREKITREMLADAQRLLPEFGIGLLDIRIKRINYVESVQQKVFDRMISERKRIAAQYRSEGEGEKAAILGQMDREMSRITSEAYRKSQEIRGKADAEATRIYAESFGRNPEFFSFYRTLELYRNFETHGSSFILSTDAEIFKYLKSSGVTPGK